MRKKRWSDSPTRLVVSGFVLLILAGTALLSLPAATVEGADVTLMDRLFMSTSAVTVTGLASVNPSVWTNFGELVFMLLVQLGGFGIMSVGAVLVVFTSHRLGLRQRMIAQAEIGALTQGELVVLVKTIAIMTVLTEGVATLVLFLRLWATGRETFTGALWSGLFHAVTSFNNAGLALYDDNLMSFVTDPVICLTISFSIIFGGLGFPVFLEMTRVRKAKRWTVHTKITLAATGLLLVVGPGAVLLFEWANPDTLGPLSVPHKLVAGWLQGVSPRTAGFNSITTGAMRPTTLLIIVVLMFIGAGAASTGGGIKVTTFAVIGISVWNEMRDGGRATIFRRSIPEASVRQALAVIVLALGTIVSATLGLLVFADVAAFDAVFETFSAFGTVGLSVGITPLLSQPALFVLSLVMLAGRVGPSTFASAIVAREHTRLYQYPEERPIIG